MVSIIIGACICNKDVCMCNLLCALITLCRLDDSNIDFVSGAVYLDFPF